MDIKDFVKGVKIIREKEAERAKMYGNHNHDEDVKYMSDMNKWLCVHTTNYEPKKNKNGQLSIQTTAMSTDNKIARATVHVTLNHIVFGHTLGNWDSMPIVVLAPYNDVVKENVEPSVVCAVDTYFIPNPDTGLVLPKSAYIVKPDNQTLYSIGDNVATYKTDHFTDEEIEEILNLQPWYREEYERYYNGDITEEEVILALRKSELDDYYYNKLKRAYEKSKDRHAFLRGYFEEARILILTYFLREYVVRMTMEKMGYKWIHPSPSVEDVVADKANNEGLIGERYGKAHSGTLENELENTWGRFDYLLNKFSTESIRDVYNKEELSKTNWTDINDPATIILESILSDTIPDFYNCYVQTANSYEKEYPGALTNIPKKKDGVTAYDQNLDTILHSNTNSQKNKKIINKLKQYAKEQFSNSKKHQKNCIAEYNQNLDTMLRRNARKMTQKYTKMINKLKQDKDYQLLLNKLKKDKQKRLTMLANRGSSRSA